VIGRGIEQLMVAFAAQAARERGARTLVGEFLPTAKNQPAAGLYERVGFRRDGDTRFTADLSARSFPYPSHIRFG
jgi:predicted enzyme involved in methoxymalonyl-ACP biosynthesis